MAFERGHKKVGGRRTGTPNRLTGAAREVAHRLLADPDYQQGLVKRLRRGTAPRLELYLWELAYGKPRVEPEPAPEGVGGNGDLLQILEKFGDAKRPDPTPPRSASPSTARDNAEDEELS